MVYAYLQTQFNYYPCTSHINYTENQKITMENLCDYMNFIVLVVNTCGLVSPRIQTGIVHQSRLKQFFAS